jgi:hypothetical protein
MPGSIIVATFLPGLTGFAATAAAFAINMVVSTIIAKSFSPSSNNNNTLGDQSNPGNPAQVPPAGDNKLPVVYGSAYVGGIITDLSITSDNQVLYYCLALSEVTNTESGGAPDTITFGNIYWGGKKVIFDANGYDVASLLDESTGLSDTSVAGKLSFYLYRNGSTNPTNSAFNAYSTSVMGNTSLVYQWDNTKLMSNCAFAILKIQYSQAANLLGLQQTRFQITNSRSAPGDCLQDYLFSTRYGAAVPTANIDSASLVALNTYCNQLMTYTPYTGGSSTLTRFRFDGALDTQQSIMTNLQYMATCCDCLLRYNEITSTWGVIVQSPTYTVTMDLNDSNIIGSINVTPLDIASSFNIAEVKFPDGTAQDSFNSATFNLAVINPSLLYPNEPVNKQTINLPLVNNSVRAQNLANRFLEACREDLQVQLTINYIGLQLEAGDIISLTNANYGWTAKLFRIAKVTENYDSEGQITATLLLTEYNSAVFDDANITEFTPSPNTGLPSINTFGTITAPTINSSAPTSASPYFVVDTPTSTAGIVDYVELWYSAYASPTTSQRIFAGTSAIASNGNPWLPSTALTVTLNNIAAGNWYFFTRMVNSIGSSPYSAASTVFQWRPTTFDYALQYLIVAYADSITGTGINDLPTNKTYYGLYNSSASSYSTNPADYTWFAASPAFGTTNKLCYINRTGRLFSFGTAPATYAAGTASYVPASTFDDTTWSALPDGVNYIDLDVRTGQLTRTGTTSTGGGQLSITNNPNGTLIGTLQQFLTFPGGASTYTSSAANITIDIYGRVVGVVPPDSFFYTSNEFTATAGQTIFTPTARQANYITGQDWVFRNGVLLDTTEYTENSTTVTMNTACVVGETVVILSFRSVNANAVYYDSLAITYSSGTGTNTCTYASLPYQTIVAGDKLTFGNSNGATITAGSFVVGTWYTILTVGTTNFTLIGAASNTVGIIFQATGAGTGTGTASVTPSQYTVSSVNYTTKQIVFTTTFTATAGATIYTFRAANAAFRSFSRFTATLTAAASYLPTTYQIYSGGEVLFLNGGLVNDQDYDLVTGTIGNFPSVATGNLTVIQFALNNFGVPNGSPAIVSTSTVIGQTNYIFNYDPLSFDLYNAGMLQFSGTDYTSTTGTSYTLAVSPTTTTNILSQQTFNRTGAA